ncbi:MAG TPA: polyprenyl diphosphate synthase [Candidatus Paceibacterota bacterium]|nr:polyprenyl diphosphate synthase [Candidatus Paceibacterota bacterium]
MVTNQNLSIPEHVAIIVDGNRRFAKKNALEAHKGHEKGKDKLEKIIESVKKFGIKKLTIYTLSVENIKNRSKLELDHLFRILGEAFEKLDRERVNNEGLKIRFIGDLNLISDELKVMCEKLEKDTKDNSNFVVNFALGYGGRQEITNAVKKIVSEGYSPDEISEKLIQKNLYLSDEPDLIIRTGGDVRTSNFLPWQSVYSEWIFLNKMWPEFEEDDLAYCIEEFKKRKRNFGK